MGCETDTHKTNIKLSLLSVQEFLLPVGEGNEGEEVGC